MSEHIRALEKAARALAERQIRINRRWDTPAERLEANVAAGIEHVWPEHLDPARIAVEAYLSATPDIGERSLDDRKSDDLLAAPTLLPDFVQAEHLLRRLNDLGPQNLDAQIDVLTAALQRADIGERKSDDFLVEAAIEAACCSVKGWNSRDITIATASAESVLSALSKGAEAPEEAPSFPKPKSRLVGTITPASGSKTKKPETDEEAKERMMRGDLR